MKEGEQKEDKVDENGEEKKDEIKDGGGGENKTNESSPTDLVEKPKEVEPPQNYSKYFSSLL